MGTTWYGSYDELVIELHGFDAIRARRTQIRLRIHDIESVRVVAANAVEPGALHLGHRKKPAVVLTTRATESIGCLAIHRRDAAEVADDLVRRGVGRTSALV